MSKKTNQRGPNGSAGPNGHADGSGSNGAYAAAPRPQSQRKNGSPRGSDGGSSENNGDAVELLHPTEVAAIEDPAAYFDAVAARVDLVGASVRLVITKDQKISKAELDRLREMKFGKAGTSAVDEPPQLDFSDWPRRNRERP